LEIIVGDMITAILLLLPLLFSVVIFFLRDRKWIRILAVSATFGELLIALYGLFLYLTQCHCNWIIDPGWDERLHVSFRFGVDNLSIVLVLVTTVLMILSVLFPFKSGDNTKPGAFYGRVLFLEMALIGAFTTSDGLFFFIFLQMILFILPSSVFRPPYRNLAIISSIFLLAALVYLYSRSPALKSFEIIYLHAAHLSLVQQVWILAAFVISLGLLILSRFTVHGSRFTVHGSRFTVHGSLYTVQVVVLEIVVYEILRFLIPVCGEVIRQIV
jgi:NADH-quinone oxidoreductase subunit M